MPDNSDPLQDYAVITELPVLWGHMDAFQHVNNTIYFRFFESARIVYGDRVGMYKFLKDDGIGPILAATGCNFLKPLRYPDTVRIGCKTIRISVSEMDQDYALYSERLGKMAATGTAKIVAYDYAQLKRSQFPELLLERILKLERGLKMT
jgi:acyl-CoA thioester hydrolase